MSDIDDDLHPNAFWRSLKREDSQFIHVYPYWQERDHALGNTDTCDCIPRVEQRSDRSSVLVVHRIIGTT